MINGFSHLSTGAPSAALSLHQCGWERCRPGHAFGPAVRAHYLMHVVMRGSGFYCVEGRRYALGPGEGFLICPGQSTYYCASEEDPWEYGWIGFDGFESKELLQRCGLSSGRPVFRDLSGGELASRLLRLVEMFEEGNNGYALLGQLYLCFSCMVIRPDAPRKSGEEEYSEKAMEFIRTNFGYDIRITDIARYVGVDRTYLYKIFVRRLGISPQRYLTEFRLELAARLLRESDLGVSEIAYSCGFQDPSAFYRYFKRQYSVTPRQYREAEYITMAPAGE
jgi:AraC-like DNA-binding protein